MQCYNKQLAHLDDTLEEKKPFLLSKEVISCQSLSGKFNTTNNYGAGIGNSSFTCNIFFKPVTFRLSFCSI